MKVRRKREMKSEEVVETVWCGQAIFFGLVRLCFPRQVTGLSLPDLVPSKHIHYIVQRVYIVVFDDQYTTVYQKKPF